MLVSNCLRPVFLALTSLIILAPQEALSDQATVPADLVLLNGKIVTVDEERPEARALAARDGIIVAVGEDSEIRQYIGEHTEVIDLEGALAIPGLIEGHAHFLNLGRSLMQLDLSTAATWDEIVAMVSQEVGRRKPGEWIVGRGWHQDKWTTTPAVNVNGLPMHHDLSRVSADNPVLLEHASGHACIANAKTMALAGITADTPDPEGGTIVRDSAGIPIGVFLETAEDRLYVVQDSIDSYRTPEESDEERLRAVMLATRECHSKGITSFHDAGASFATIDFYRQLAAEGDLGLRLWVMISEDNASLQEKIDDYLIIGESNNYLTVRAVKRLIDGALGSRGAWLLEPYSDLPQSSGLNTEPIESMKETARIAIEHGFQLCTHAIGDRGNREVLNVYEDCFRAYPDKSDLRWRIEHAQHLHPADIPRFAQLGVIASMQGIHCTSDGPWVPNRLGDKRSAEGAYVWRELITAGTTICCGTDAPVERVDPIANYHALITRRLSDGTIFFPGQVMTPMEALQSYTINCACAAFEENIKGSLKVGKLADITVLSKDILTVVEEEMLDTEVLYTIVGGNIMYQR